MINSLNKTNVLGFSFSDEDRILVSIAVQWNERELEALCFGISPAKYCNRDGMPSQDEQQIIRETIRRAIESGALDATRGNGNAIYGGLLLIEPAHALRWAFENNFPKFPEWLFSDGLKDKWAIQTAEKLAEGRYTLVEAANAIGLGASERDDQILTQLEKAARTGALGVYAPGQKLPYAYGEGANGDVRVSYKEAYWYDLNKWLMEYAPLIKFRLPAPSDGVKHVVDKLPVGTSPAVKGVTKAQILTAFDGLVTSMRLGKAMSDGETKWLLDARVSKGAKGKRGQHQSTWEPLIFAVALYERKLATLTGLSRAFHTHSFLADWRDGWKEQEESLG